MCKIKTRLSVTSLFYFLIQMLFACDLPVWFFLIAINQQNTLVGLIGALFSPGHCEL